MNQKNENNSNGASPKVRTWRERMGVSPDFPLSMPSSVERAMEEEIAELRAGAEGSAQVLRALRDGIPLQGPVNIGKALRARRLARPVLSGGTGPVAAVHLVNIGLTGWVYTEETALAYARGFNDALKYYRDALLEVAIPERITAPEHSGTPPGLIGFLEVVRDENGWWSHPGIPDTGEDISAWNAWIEQQGLETAYKALESYPEHPLHDPWFEDGECNASSWNPEAPAGDGWFTLSIHDTEDGPAWVWARRMDGDKQGGVA